MCSMTLSRTTVLNELLEKGNWSLVIYGGKDLHIYFYNTQHSMDLCRHRVCHYSGHIQTNTQPISNGFYSPTIYNWINNCFL